MRHLAYTGKEELALCNLSLTYCKEFLAYRTISLLIILFGLHKASLLLSLLTFN
jgi:hypothetical protein